MQVKDVMAAVDRLAPFDLAEPWDHVGLQVGSPGDELSCGGSGTADVAENWTATSSTLMLAVSLKSAPRRNVLKARLLLVTPNMVFAPMA